MIMEIWASENLNAAQVTRNSELPHLKRTNFSQYFVTTDNTKFPGTTTKTIRALVS
jgi:hypothetical protein